MVSYDRPATELTQGDEDAMDGAVATLEDAGLTTAVGGDAFADQATAAGAAEGIGVLVALVVLTITFGSLVAAGMPLVTAIIGVGVGILGVTTLTGFVDLSSTTPALATMLGLAVGIDYALFVMSRYRHEVSSGRDPEEAAGRAIGTAGSAVVFAGLTVIIALAGLSLTGITFLTQMGLAGAATVAVAVVIALTLLPALLGRWPAAGSPAPGCRVMKVRDPEADDQRTNGRRWVDFVSRFRWPALVAGLAVAATLAIPLASMELALPDDGTAPAGTGRRQAYDLVARELRRRRQRSADRRGRHGERRRPGGRGGGGGRRSPATIPEDVAAVVHRSPTDDRREGRDGVRAAARRRRLRHHHRGPRERAVRRGHQGPGRHLRVRTSPAAGQTGARALVTGQTAVGVDISQSLADVFPLYLLVVVGLAFVLLVLVFRSILVPLKAALGFLLSIGISLGATVAVFQWGWLHELLGLDATAPVVFILPLLLTGILFGLAMDYEVFLVTRMREEYVHGAPARQAVVIGFQHSARVVTAAAIIMIGVFAGFALGDDPIIKTIGFALAVGVLADAFLVRMTIVPAVMLIVGERIWWIPRWLDRLLPNLDIEGEDLGRRLAAGAPRRPSADISA